MKDKVDWWDLANTIKLALYKHPKEIKKLGNFTSVKRLKDHPKKESISKEITGIKKDMMGNKKFSISFPIFLDNMYFAQLYALMTSEGSYKTEFSLNVPEIEFHEIFRVCIEKLISKEASDNIIIDKNNNILRSRAPAILRKIIPLPDKIPNVILNDKELAKEYIRVAFEAEGSPIINKSKRYIKLTRYTDITSFFNIDELPSEKRIYSGTLKKKNIKKYEKIVQYPPNLLLSEQLILKKYFNIESKLVLEAIRKNKTDFRAGKVTARWVLLIYANNIDRFIEKVRFISSNKNKKLFQMKKIRGNNPQYFSLKIIQEVSKNGYFCRKEFIDKMKKIGYKSPACYLNRYEKKGLIKRIKKGYYKILF